MNSEKTVSLSSFVAGYMQVSFYLVAGFASGGEQVTGFYSAHRHNQDTARKVFTETYHTIGVKGITVRPLYENRRYR